MVIQMAKKNKKKKLLNENISTSIIVIAVAVVIVIGSIIMRYKSYSQTWLVCEKDLTSEYHEVLKFRYDADDKLFGYYREEILHNMSEETINTNYDYFMEERKKVEANLSDNFVYDVTKNEDGTLTAKTYIGVSVFPSFFNGYLNNEAIKNNTPLNDVKNHLEANNYTCKTSRK